MKNQSIQDDDIYPEALEVFEKYTSFKGWNKAYFNKLVYVPIAII